MSILAKTRTIKKIKQALCLAVKEVPSNNWIGSTLNNEFEKLLLGMDKEKRRTGKVFTDEMIVHFVKDEILNLSEKLGEEDYKIVSQKFEEEMINSFKTPKVNNGTP